MEFLPEGAEENDDPDLDAFTDKMKEMKKRHLCRGPRKHSEGKETEKENMHLQ